MKIKKILPYILIILALVTIVTGFYGYYLKHMAQQLVENWLRIEQVSIQQGNIFSSLATSNRILMSSGSIRSVMLFDVQHNQINEMASYGEYMTVSDIPDMDAGSIESIFYGPYQVQTFVKFEERPNLVAVFRTESSDVLAIFIFVLSLLTLIVFGFSLYIQGLARKEELNRLAIIKIALEDLLNDVPPRQFVVGQIPHILKYWSSIRETFEQIKLRFENSARDRLIAQTSQMLGHDLRAPLGVFESLLMARDDELQTMRGPLKESLNRIYAMVEALRNYELESFVRPKLSTFDFNIDFDSLKAKAAIFKISIRLPKQIEFDLFIDKPKVDRAWLNLAFNAIEFASTEVKVEAFINESYFIFRVIDDGGGVSDEILPKLFQRGATHKADGTGLGLAYVKQIMRGHGGDVTYRREHGLTIFECQLPHGIEVEKEQAVENTVSLEIQPLQTVICKVAICLQPAELSKAVLEQMCPKNSEKFFFSEERGNANVVVSNDEDIMIEVLERDDQEYISVAQLKGDYIRIVDLLKRKFKIG